MLSVTFVWENAQFVRPKILGIKLVMFDQVLQLFLVGEIAIQLYLQFYMHHSSEVGWIVCE